MNVLFLTGLFPISKGNSAPSDPAIICLVHTAELYQGRKYDEPLIPRFELPEMPCQRAIGMSGGLLYHSRALPGYLMHTQTPRRMTFDPLRRARKSLLTFANHPRYHPGCLAIGGVFCHKSLVN